MKEKVGVVFDLYEWAKTKWVIIPSVIRLLIWLLFATNVFAVRIIENAVKILFPKVKG